MSTQDRKDSSCLTPMLHAGRPMWWQGGKMENQQSFKDHTLYASYMLEASAPWIPDEEIYETWTGSGLRDELFFSKRRNWRQKQRRLDRSTQTLYPHGRKTRATNQGQLLKVLAVAPAAEVEWIPLKVRSTSIIKIQIPMLNSGMLN